MIILVGAEKGGVGKTTLATNLSVMALRKGLDTLLVDTDIMNSSLAFANQRSELAVEPQINVISVFGKQVIQALKDASARYDLVIVDSGGRDTVEFRYAMGICDRLLMPTTASQYDVWSAERVHDMVEQAVAFNQGLEREAYVVVNRASSNPMVSEVQEAKEALAGLPLFQVVSKTIKDRKIFRDSVQLGRAVCEMPSSKARTAGITDLSFVYDQIVARPQAEVA